MVVEFVVVVLGLCGERGLSGGMREGVMGRGSTGGGGGVHGGARGDVVRVVARGGGQRGGGIGRVRGREGRRGRVVLSGGVGLGAGGIDGADISEGGEATVGGATVDGAVLDAGQGCLVDEVAKRLVVLHGGLEVLALVLEKAEKVAEFVGGEGAVFVFVEKKNCWEGTRGGEVGVWTVDEVFEGEIALAAYVELVEDVEDIVGNGGRRGSGGGGGVAHGGVVGVLGEEGERGWGWGGWEKREILRTGGGREKGCGGGTARGFGTTYEERGVSRNSRPVRCLGLKRCPEEPCAEEVRRKGSWRGRGGGAKAEAGVDREGGERMASTKTRYER